MTILYAAFRKIVWLLLPAALLGGAAVTAQQVSLIRQWQRADAQQRDAMRYGYTAPLVEKVKKNSSETSAFLLSSRLDPALLPYALYPRRLYQRETDPETNRVYMDLPPSVYPSRPAESFHVDADLYWSEENWRQGGELRPRGVRP